MCVGNIGLLVLVLVLVLVLDEFVTAPDRRATQPQSNYNTGLLSFYVPGGSILKVV
jgi:hypothetical protein